MYLKAISYKLKASATGQAILSLVLIVGGIVAFVSVTLAFIVLNFVNSSSGFVKANRALATASAGIQDATLRLVRNKDFTSPTPYTISLGPYSAAVTVVQGSPNPGQVTVVSDAIVSFYERKVQAVFAVGSSTGETQLISWGELSL
jgi:hypothetical protein